MQYITGFTPGRYIFNKELGKYAPDIRAGIHQFLVYETNGLIKKSIFGDEMLPVLRHVTLGTSSTDVVEVEFPNPVWIPIATKFIEELHIEIRTYDGEELMFEYGGVTIVIAIKRDMGL